MTEEENRLLTRVENDAPMGRLMRHNYWMPFALAEQIVAGGAPRRVRLLGRDYVAFRAEDGRLAMFDERCPHRGASLALARNEGNALRCIFHGWKFDVSGRAVEVPTQAAAPERFAANLNLPHYPVHEAGGIAWAWLGGGAAPSFPDLPFAGKHETNSWLSVSKSDCNWLQGVEGTLDSAHIGTLHQTWIGRSYAKRGAKIGMTLDAAPRYEVQNAPYGLRAAALRERNDGSTYLRVSEYFMPFICLVAAQRDPDGTIFMVSPVDDTHHLLFFGLYSYDTAQNPERNYATVLPGTQYDRFDFATLTAGRDDNWGQKRESMKQGHFTGFDRNILEEDIVVQVSMGEITDRTLEHLSASDVAIVQMRRMLLDALRTHDRLPPGSARAATPPKLRHPIDTVLTAGESWQSR
jgi:phthalate 4,5-dioxygenase oxygenase subunit